MCWKDGMCRKVVGASNLRLHCVYALHQKDDCKRVPPVSLDPPVDVVLSYNAARHSQFPVRLVSHDLAILAYTLSM